MKINFLLPTIDLCGGIKVVFEYANHLQERGHQVSVIYPQTKIFFAWPCREWYNPYRIAYRVLQGIRKYQRSASPSEQLNWFNLKAELLRVPSLAERYLPDADIVVATHWATAHYAHTYTLSKGRKFYLIQHYEILLGRKDKVEKTYKMGLGNIVISTWLKKIIEQLGGKVEAVIPDGIDFQEFYPEPMPRQDSKVRILMPYRYERWKGLKDGIKAYELVKKKYPVVQLVVFGPPPRKNELPKEVEFHIIPTKDRLRRVYNLCDIFVFPSWCEGFGLPPLEAMACKCAVVTTRVGAMLDYAVDGQTALISAPRDIDALAKNISRLVEDKTQRLRIAESGYNHIKQLTWANAVEKIEGVFRAKGLS
jgi:hypothetical protein